MKLINKVVGEHIDVRTFLAKDLPTIHADRGQIEQVLMNLCLNARDAMPEGGQLLVETEETWIEIGDRRGLNEVLHRIGRIPPGEGYGAGLFQIERI